MKTLIILWVPFCVRGSYTYKVYINNNKYRLAKANSENRRLSRQFQTNRTVAAVRESLNATLVLFFP